MAKYEKKCVQKNFESIWDGSRNSDIRKCHCNYKVGDIIIFKEVKDVNIYSRSHNDFIDSEEYTGRYVVGEITHIAKNLHGLKLGRCLITFKPVSRRNEE